MPGAEAEDEEGGFEGVEPLDGGGDGDAGVAALLQTPVVDFFTPVPGDSSEP